MARSVNGSPSDNVTVSIKQSLLDRLDRHCAKTELSKSQVMSIALKRYLAAEMACDPVFWDVVYDKYEAEGKL